ncbi:lipocalin-like domain-containing protein [Methylocystis echinoides]|uniref:lipocalin-like domain-containing protein n=1 Tax=Methylocystis echinoides TaxID=29468 RepID=UPI003449A0AC
MKGKKLAFLGLLLPALAQAQGYGGLSSPAPGFDAPKPGTPIVFPKDHGPHPTFRTEWWYLTANLQGADGATYGVQWTLFRHALEPGAGAGWGDRNVFMGHAAATSATRHEFAQTMARGGVGQAGVAAAPFLAFIDDWAFEAKDDGFTQARVTARGPHFSYNLDLTRQGPFVLQGDVGFSLKASTGQASHYYSAPFLSVDGALSFDGREIKVTGRAWMDREWSSQSLAPDQKGWDWFSLHLASGEKVMVYRFRGADTHCSGNWIAADGTTRLLADEDISLTPRAETAINGKSVPTRWRLQVKSHGLDVETSPLNPKSWMGTTFSYWEGPISIAGSQSGEGYLEMTGY